MAGDQVGHPPRGDRDGGDRHREGRRRRAGRGARGAADPRAGRRRGRGGRARPRAGRAPGIAEPDAAIAFALALAWLFAWPYVLPWYDALGWALLPLVPLARSGGPWRASAGCCWPGPRRSASAIFRPGRPTRRCRPGSAGCSPWSGTAVTPAILAAATVWLVVLMVRSGRAARSEPPGPGEPRVRRTPPRSQRSAREGRHAVSTATGVPASAEAGRRGPASWPGRLAGRLAGLAAWALMLLGVLAWIAALAALEPLVRGYLTSVPDQRLVDLNVYRTGGLSVLQGQPLYTVLTPPPQLLPFTYPPVAALFAVPLALLPWHGRPAGLGAGHLPAARGGHLVRVRPAAAPGARPGAARGGVRGHLRGLRLPVPDAGRNAVRPGGHGAARDGPGGLRGPVAALAARRAGGPRHRDQAGARGVHRVPVAVRAAACRGDRGGRGAGLDTGRLAAAAG